MLHFIPPSGRIGNLIWAGRCLSASHVAMSALRVMPLCFAMGQAAGTAAALAVESQCDFGMVDIKLLQNVLKSVDVYL